MGSQHNLQRHQVGYFSGASPHVVDLSSQLLFESVPSPGNFGGFLTPQIPSPSVVTSSDSDLSDNFSNAFANASTHPPSFGVDIGEEDVSDDDPYNPYVRINPPTASEPPPQRVSEEKVTQFLPAISHFGGFTFPQDVMLDAFLKAESFKDVGSPIELSHTQESLRNMPNDQLVKLVLELQLKLSTYARSSLWTSIQTLKNNPLSYDPLALSALSRSKKDKPNKRQRVRPIIFERAMSGNLHGQLNQKTSANHSSNNPHVNNNNNSPANNNSHVNPSKLQKLNPGPIQMNQNLTTNNQFNVRTPTDSTPETLAMKNPYYDPSMSANASTSNAYMSSNMLYGIPNSNGPPSMTGYRHTPTQQNIPQNMQQNQSTSNWKEEVLESRTIKDMIFNMNKRLSALPAAKFTKHNIRTEVTNLMDVAHPMVKTVMRLPNMHRTTPELMDRGFILLATLLSGLQETRNTNREVEEILSGIPWEDIEGQERMGLMQLLWYTWNTLLSYPHLIKPESLHRWSSFLNQYNF